MAIVKTLIQKKQCNVLDAVKLIAKYHPVMIEHLSDIQALTKRMPTYLSPTIQNQLIDSTTEPDVSHTDQMAFFL